MRTPKELFEILRDNIHLLKRGLCVLVFTLWMRNIITHSEQRFLLHYIVTTKLFMKHVRMQYLNGSHAGYYWRCGKIKPRLKWINKQIKKLS
jgi:hypothetical protein